MSPKCPQAEDDHFRASVQWANSPGHIAGAYLPADIHVRHLRSMGEDVLWLWGDEHGAAITLRARRGDPPRNIIAYHVEMPKTSRDSTSL